MIELNKEEFDKLQQKHGWNETEMALKMDIDNATLWRVKNGQNKPGSSFITGALKAFPEATFEDLFFMPEVLRSRNKDAEAI